MYIVAILHGHHLDTYNRFDNILRLFNILPNFSFLKSKTMHNYYL